MNFMRAGILIRLDFAKNGISEMYKHFLQEKLIFLTFGDILTFSNANQTQYQ